MYNFPNRLLSHHQLPRSSNKCTINKTSKTIPIQTNTKLYWSRLDGLVVYLKNMWGLVRLCDMHHRSDVPPKHVSNSNEGGGYKYTIPKIPKKKKNLVFRDFTTLQSSALWRHETDGTQIQNLEDKQLHLPEVLEGQMHQTQPTVESISKASETIRTCCEQGLT